MRVLVSCNSEKRWTSVKDYFNNYTYAPSIGLSALFPNRFPCDPEFDFLLHNPTQNSHNQYPIGCLEYDVRVVIPLAPKELETTINSSRRGWSLKANLTSSLLFFPFHSNFDLSSKNISPSTIKKI